MNALDLATQIYSNPLVKWILGLLVANIVSGIAVALAPGNPERFRIGALADWLMRALVYLLGGGTVSLVVYVSPLEYAAWSANLSTLVWGLVILALVGKILDNLKTIFPGAPIPAFLTDRREHKTTATP